VDEPRLQPHVLRRSPWAVLRHWERPSPFHFFNFPDASRFACAGVVDAKRRRVLPRYGFLQLPPGNQMYMPMGTIKVLIG
jgi:hypothetical protein